MRIIRLAALLATLAFAGAAVAQNLPNYYPKTGFNRIGSIDALIFEEQRIVIDDMSFNVSPNVVVHSPRSYSVPASSLRIGTRVGYKLLSNSDRTIIEIWLLPDNYQNPGRRR